NGHEAVDLEIGEGRVDATEGRASIEVLEISGRADAFSGVGARGADEDAALVPETSEIAIGEDAVVLASDEGGLLAIVFLEARVAVEEPDDLDAAALERRCRSGNDRVCRRGGAAREDEPDAADRRRRR